MYGGIYKKLHYICMEGYIKNSIIIVNNKANEKRKERKFRNEAQRF